MRHFFVFEVTVGSYIPIYTRTQIRQRMYFTHIVVKLYSGSRLANIPDELLKNNLQNEA